MAAQRWGALALLLVIADAAWAVSDVAEASCPADVDLSRLQIRQVRVRAPLAVLPWTTAGVAAAQRQLNEDLKGRPYRKEDIAAARAKVEQEHAFAQIDVEQPVAIRFIAVKPTACSDGAVDLEFIFFVPRLSPTLGVAIAGGRLRMTPSLEYDRAEKMSLGVRGGWSTPRGPAMAVDARAARDAHALALALQGSTEHDTGVAAQTQWRVDYQNNKDPAPLGKLNQEGMGISASLATRPIGAWEMPAYFGGTLERGHYSSQFVASSLPMETTAGSRYRAMKMYGGTSGRASRQTFAASYGVEWGSAEGGSKLDWVKQIIDVSHELSLPVSDHSKLAFESHLWGGHLRVPGSAPVGVRFFGGGREKPFITAEQWSVRGNPVLRSMGNNDFSGDGAGATRAGAFNLTVALPWRGQPLVPAELTSSQDFRDALTFQLESATTELQNTYAAGDPSFRMAVASLPALRQALRSLKDSVAAAQTATPGTLGPLFTRCLRAIDMADRRAASAVTGSGGGQIGFVRALLPPESSDDDAENRLGIVDRECAEQLNSTLRDSDIAAKSGSVASMAQTLRTQFHSVDQTVAKRKAEDELRTAKRTLKVIVDEMNLWSLSPLLMFDAVHMNTGGTRYGLGLGLRLTLADSVGFSLGYMANCNRRPNEPPGAFVMSLQIKDLF